jgi:ribosomal protein L40E
MFLSSRGDISETPRACYRKRTAVVVVADSVSAYSCPFCDRANPPGAKYCNECGSPLHLTPCRRCGAVNHVTDAQCHQCGGSTGRAVADAMPVDAQLREVEALLRGFEYQLGAGEERAEHEAPAAEARREPAAGAEAPAAAGRQADAPELAAQPQAAMREFGDFQMREVASPVNARLEEPSRRWPRYLTTGLIAVTALVLPAGGYLYHRSEPSPDLAVGEPPAPIAALSQASGGPTESRVDAAVSEPPPTTEPAPAAATEAPCPAAVEAMALCDWAVRAERR